MHNNDEDDRINALKRQAAEMGMLTSWESGALPADVRERFWRNVVKFETAPVTTLTRELHNAGYELPEPESMTDEQLSTKLSEVIDALARFRVFLSFTDHLSDRELYALLLRRELPREIQLLPIDPRSAWHFDLLGDGGEDGAHLYLKYYADEDARRQWLADFPDDEIPAHEDLPYDRDRHLPTPY